MNEDKQFGAAIGQVTTMAQDQGLVYNTTGRYDTNRMLINSTVPNHNIIFHGPSGKEVGRFDFNEGTMKFDGDANEAAKVFTEWARNHWSDLRDKDKAEVLDAVIHDIIAESSGELYSEEEKIAMLTCLQLVQKRKKEHSAPQVAEQYSANLAQSMQATKEATITRVLSALAPEGKSL